MTLGDFRHFRYQGGITSYVVDIGRSYRRKLVQWDGSMSCCMTWSDSSKILKTDTPWGTVILLLVEQNSLQHFVNEISRENMHDWIGFQLCLVMLTDMCWLICLDNILLLIDHKVFLKPCYSSLMQNFQIKIAINRARLFKANLGELMALNAVAPDMTGWSAVMILIM